MQKTLKKLLMGLACGLALTVGAGISSASPITPGVSPSGPF